MVLNKTASRFAGLMYLLTIVTGIFTEVFVRSKFIVWHDAAATAQNIMASGLLFRLGIVSDLMMAACFLLTGYALYALFKPVNKNAAALLMFLVLASVSILAINTLNQFAPLLLLSGADYLRVFTTDQLNALALFFMNLQKYGYTIAEIGFGTYFFPLGYLILKSEGFPGIFGILFIIAGFGDMTDLLAQFLLPDYAVIISQFALMPAALAEISFCLWLLIKGAKMPAIKSELSPE